MRKLQSILFRKMIHVAYDEEICFLSPSWIKGRYMLLNYCLFCEPVIVFHNLSQLTTLSAYKAGQITWSPAYWQPGLCVPSASFMCYLLHSVYFFDVCHLLLDFSQVCKSTQRGNDKLCGVLQIQEESLTLISQQSKNPPWMLQHSRALGHWVCNVKPVLCTLYEI